MKYNYKQVTDYLNQKNPTHQKAQEHFNISKATWYRWLDKHRVNEGAGVEDLRLQLQAVKDELKQIKSEHFAMVELIVDLGAEIGGEPLKAYQVPKAALEHREEMRQRFLATIS